MAFKERCIALLLYSAFLLPAQKTFKCLCLFSAHRDDRFVIAFHFYTQAVIPPGEHLAHLLQIDEITFMAPEKGPSSQSLFKLADPFSLIILSFFRMNQTSL